MRGPVSCLMSFLAAACVVVFPMVSRAGHPLGTEDPGTVAPGHVWAEFTGEFNRYGDGSEMEAAVSITTGILPRVDVTAWAPYLVANPDEGDAENGLGDVELSLKWNVVQSEDYPSLALKGTVKFPSADEDKELGSGEFDFTASAILAKVFGPLEIYLNVGYTWMGVPKGEDWYDVWSYSLAGQFEIAERWYLVAEVAGETSLTPDDDDPLAVTAGVIREVNENLYLDAGARAGLSDASPDWSLLAGVSLSY